MFEHFQIHEHSGLTELHLADTTYYDLEQYSQLHQELMEFVERDKPHQLVVNFDRIRYSSTALINGILKTQERVAEAGGKVRLYGMCDSVRDAFKMLGLDGTLFTIYDSEADARAAF
jgi:anti-anti-sigma factor